MSDGVYIEHVVKVIIDTVCVDAWRDCADINNLNI